MARDVGERSKEETAIESASHSAGAVDSTSLTYPINMSDQEKPKGARPVKAAICHPHLPMYGSGLTNRVRQSKMLAFEG